MEPATKTAYNKTKVIEPDPLDPAVVLTHADLASIGRMLKRNIRDQEELFRAIESASAVSVEGTSITLEPRLLQRLKSRCHDKGNWPRFLQEVVITQLHDFAGW